MGQVTSLFLRKVISAADGSIDKAALLRSVGINPDSPPDPSQMLVDTDYYDFLERLAALEQDATTLPLRTGDTMRCDDYGAFGLAWKSAINLRGSYQRAERHARVLTSVATYQLEDQGDSAFMNLHRLGTRRLGLRLSSEATIASIMSISRQVSTVEFKPTAVFFKHAAPKSIVDHESYFACPVFFEADRDALLVSNEMLETPNNQGDQSIATFFDTYLANEVAKIADIDAFHRQVQQEVSRSLSEGVPVISKIAERFSMSNRTLQRRLSDQGYSYQTLVHEARQQLAERLLQRTDYSLSEVAFMTGFSEQSAFTRAFKRWLGQTPRSFRIQSQPKPH